MIGDRLELPAIRGDQSIGSVNFVVRGSSADAAAEISERGLRFMEGRPVVTTNLSKAAEFAAGGGVLTVLAVPTEFHLGYAAMTTAYVERATKLVLGSPLRYAEGRNQLSLYMDEDTEAARRRIETDLVSGRGQVTSFVVDAQHVLGTFQVSETLNRVLSWVDVGARSFEAIEYARVTGALEQLFDCREPAQQVLVPSTMEDLVTGMVEAVILSEMRQLRWEGLALLGYRFREDRNDVQMNSPGSVVAQRQRLDERGRLLASSTLFTGELAWLKTYVAHQLELMRVELEGAELESA